MDPKDIGWRCFSKPKKERVRRGQPPVIHYAPFLPVHFVPDLFGCSFATLSVWRGRKSGWYATARLFMMAGIRIG